MRYFYRAAWTIVGGINLQPENSPIKLVGSEKSRFLLTLDPETNLTKVDESLAIGLLMLRGVGGKREDTDFLSSLTTEIEDINIRRKKKIKGQAVLLLEAQGEIEAEVKEPLKEYDNFIVAYDIRWGLQHWQH